MYEYVCIPSLCLVRLFLSVCMYVACRYVYLNGIGMYVCMYVCMYDHVCTILVFGLGLGLAQDLGRRHRSLGGEVDELVQAQDPHASEVS